MSLIYIVNFVICIFLIYLDLSLFSHINMCTLIQLYIIQIFCESITTAKRYKVICLQWMTELICIQLILKTVTFAISKNIMKLKELDVLMGLFAQFIIKK